MAERKCGARVTKFSPDGRVIGYVRCTFPDGKCALAVSSADGRFAAVTQAGPCQRGFPDSTPEINPSKN